MKGIYAECDNRLFIKANYSGIHQLILITDGLAHYYFRKGKTPYLDIQDVLKWHQKELEYGTNRVPQYSKNYLNECRRIIKLITKVIEDFENEKLLCKEIKNDRKTVS